MTQATSMPLDTSSNPFEAGGNSVRLISENAEAEEVRTFVTFELSNQWLAVDVQHVREILDRQEVTQVPRPPANVEGVIDVRGTAVPVMNLAQKLGLLASVESQDTRFLVLEFGDADAASNRTVAVRTDRVLEVSQITEESIEFPPKRLD